MKNVRVKYIKYGTAKYISHLDMNRCITRVLQRAKLPIWRTEGFNPHLFITFALPLSLGFTGMAEYMDMRLTEEVEFEDVITSMNKYMPQGIEVKEVYEPQMAPSKIAYSLFNIKLTSDIMNSNELKDKLAEYLQSESIIVPKKTKSGIKDIDLKPYINEYSLNLGEDCVCFEIKLPAGSTVNINPMLIITAAQRDICPDLYADVTRVELYTEDNEIFR